MSEEGVILLLRKSIFSKLANLAIRLHPSFFVELIARPDRLTMGARLGVLTARQRTRPLTTLPELIPRLKLTPFHEPRR